MWEEVYRSLCERRSQLFRLTEGPAARAFQNRSPACERSWVIGTRNRPPAGQRGKRRGRWPAGISHFLAAAKRLEYSGHFPYVTEREAVLALLPRRDTRTVRR